MMMSKLRRWMVVLPAVGLLAACHIPGSTSPNSTSSGGVYGGGGAYTSTAPATSAPPPTARAHATMPMPTPTAPPAAMPRVIHTPRTLVDDVHIRTLHCHGTGTTPATVLPDPTCTPGAVDPAVTQDTLKTTICKPGYTATVRPRVAATTLIKGQAMTAYALNPKKTSGYELDHLIPLELGGASATSNLWPELGVAPNPKDKIEDRLHTAVCNGTLTLDQAQQAIATDWTHIR